MARFATVDEAETCYKDELLQHHLTIRRWLYFVDHARIDDQPTWQPQDRAAAVLAAQSLLPVIEGAPCKGCNEVPRLRRFDGKLLGMVCECGCGRNQSILKGSMFENHPPEKYVPAMLLFVQGSQNRSMATLASDVDIQRRTLREWSTEWQGIMGDQLATYPWIAGTKVGGPGLIVQVDESFFNRPKRGSRAFCASAGARRRQRWIWGAVGEDGANIGDVFLLVLPEDDDPARSAAVLMECLIVAVARGSIIVHDDWGGYRKIDWAKLKREYDFEHRPECVVNHSKEIVNLWGFHTQRIEAVWGVLKRWLWHWLLGTRSTRTSLYWVIGFSIAFVLTSHSHVIVRVCAFCICSPRWIRTKHGGRVPWDRAVVFGDVDEWVWRKKSGNCMGIFLDALR